MTESNQPKDNPPDEAIEANVFADKAQRMLRESESQVSTSRKQQLASARAAAVAAAGSSGNSARGWFTDFFSGGLDLKPWLLAPAGVAAAAVLTVALLWRGSVEPLPLLEPAEITVAQELELLEDLEFVAWMMEQDDVGAG